MTSNFNALLFTIVLLALCNGAWCFGSGDISELSGLEDKAYRHGDIENTLLELLYTVGSSSIIKSFIKKAVTGSKGKKFDDKNVKRVYFGNWTRDLSQAMDVSTLTKFSPKMITSIVAVLGFISFGYGSREFEVNEDVLGCYRPEEHIDNPNNYANAPDGSPRDITGYHKLRGGLVDGELDFDRNAMKNYIANDDGDWDTSSKYVRQTLIECIELGRKAREDDNDEDMWVALRLLGYALHTLEDYAAHSNFIEVTLQMLGYSDVFTHVGDNVRFESPSGKRVSPIVTGTFGGADFFHSLLGEATDKLSSKGIGDLSTTLSQSKDSNVDNFRKVLTKLLKSKDKGEADDSEDGHPDADDKVNRLEEIRRRARENSNVDENELHDIVYEVITIHDDITRSIEAVMDKIPFINEIMDEASNTLQVFIYSTIEPLLSPVLKDLKDALYEASACVIDDDSQRIVFDDPNASDPTHSMLAKDHFGNILNQPAGRLAKVIITHAVNAVVKDGWDGDADPRSIADECLKALHHPEFESDAPVQKDMVNFVREWIESQGHEKDEVLRRLERDSVLEHRNTTDGLSGGSMNPSEQDKYGKYHGADQGLQGLAASGALNDLPGGKELSQGINALHLGGGDKNESVERSRYGSNNASQYQSSHEYGGGSSGYGQEHSSGRHHQSSGYGGGREESNTYGSSGYGNEYGSRRQDESSYGGGDNYSSGGRHHSSGYGDSGRDNYSRQQESSYGNYSSGGRHHSSGYGGAQQESTYGSSGYGGSGNDDYGSRHQSSYGSGNDYSSGRQGYGGQESAYGSGGYGGGRQESNTYGSSGYGGSGNDDYGSRHQSSYGSGNDYSSGRQGYGGQESAYGSGGYGGGRQESTYGGNYGGSGNDYGSSGYGGRSGDDYASRETYGGSNTYGDSSYGDSNRHQQSSYENRDSYGSGGYGGSGNTYGSSGYGGQDDEYSRGNESYRSGNEYGSGQDEYGSSRYY